MKVTVACPNPEMARIPRQRARISRHMAWIPRHLAWISRHLERISRHKHESRGNRRASRGKCVNHEARGVGGARHVASPHWPQQPMASGAHREGGRGLTQGQRGRPRVDSSCAGQRVTRRADAREQWQGHVARSHSSVNRDATADATGR